ncbi:ESCRT-I complex subunit TSG101 [Cryptococcus gattii EJB2]|uniref:ESCRT-I complex subunit TSG101 n=1 Tax=Cryptococcus gattii EJB2 TaxID=1296103 RepID=A0ABR5C318_9TREE|nr:ESCRT-I complex subunit TSG101 [Cryptococcus gattii EJB2]KJE02064.1 ESCRT-I complex subunit TSG101 [Cryptococcus gattii NT-10]
MSSLSLTREWLHSVLRPFPARESITQEVLHILQQRRTLAVKTDAFTFDSGHTALLLLLHGTLPVTYRGAIYQIPIHLWIPHEYPRAPPLVFVMPTKDMGVRKSREVEPSGRVREEIVEEWWRAWEAKNLDMLLKHLADVFSAAPPVYAKPSIPSQGQSLPSGARTSTPDVQTATTQPPIPPARPTFGHPHPEILPVYRPAPTPPPHPYSHNPVRQASSPMSSAPQHVQTPPRESPSMSNQPRQTQSPSPSLTAPPVPQRPYSGVGPIPQGSGSLQQHYTGQQQSWQGASASRPPTAAGVMGSQNAAAVQPWLTAAGDNGNNAAHPGQHTNYSPSHPRQAQKSQSLPVPRQPPQDLLSSPGLHSTVLNDESDDPSGPPPIPPSKPPPPSLLHLHSILLSHLNASMPPLVNSLHSSVEHLRARQEDLVTGEPAIRDEMARLEAVKKVCDSVGKKMEEVVAKGGERVADLESKGEVSVDELVCGISIVHNQLIDLVAEDNAIEDTIYHMTRALDAERVDVDRYLKSIRSLAREQYMKRALIERIIQGMGQKQGW